MKNICRFLTFAILFSSIRLLGATHYFVTYHVSPMETLALFSTIFIGRTVINPLFIILVLLISDTLLNALYFGHFTMFYPGFYWQYAGMLSLVGLGAIMLNQPRLFNVVAASVFGPVAFYLISNFGVVMSGNLYPKTIYGFYSAYLMGLPFLKISLVNTVLFSLITFFILKIKILSKQNASPLIDCR